MKLQQQVTDALTLLYSCVEATNVLHAGYIIEAPVINLACAFHSCYYVQWIEFVTFYTVLDILYSISNLPTQFGKTFEVIT